MNIILLLFCLSIIFCMRFKGEKGVENRDQDIRIRGIMSILVILHHMSLTVNGVDGFVPLTQIGYAAVSYFYFVSGYGLMKQYLHNENYLDDFIPRRVVSLIVKYFFFCIAYYFVYMAVGKNYSIEEIVTSFLQGNPYVLYSWYIISILLFYLIFFIMAKVLKKYIWIVAGMMAFCLLYAVIIMKLDWGGEWYHSHFPLLLGMLIGNRNVENKINNLYKRNRWILVLSMFGFMVLQGYRIAINYQIISCSALMNHLAKVMVSCMCVIFIYFVSKEVSIKGNIWLKLGKISLYIYMSQGISFILLEDIIEELNKSMASIIVIIVTVTIAFCIEKFLGFIQGIRKIKHENKM